MAILFLGLGSNIGCRLTQLQNALRALQKIADLRLDACSPIYQSKALLKDGAPASWDQDYFNIVVQCDYPHSPEELLAACKAIEASLGRDNNAARWSPRCIDIDILAWAGVMRDEPHLHIPHPDILNRSFVLKPLLDIAPDWCHPNKPDLHLSALAETLGKEQQLKRSPLRLRPPFLMGILNITPDSFSDGGLFDDLDAAREHFTQLINAGAHIIDIGAESTRPNATLLTPEEEWRRLEPVLTLCREVLSQLPLIHRPKISVDTRHVATVERCLAHGVDWINDVEGHDLNAKAALLAGTNTRYVTMHHLGVPPQKNCVVDGDPVTTLLEFALQRFEMLCSLGLDASQVIFDIGLGFGKNARQTQTLLQHLEQFSALPIPVLVGHSRKSFMQAIHPSRAHDRDLETALVTALLPPGGCDYLRVHNVDAARRALSVRDWLHHANTLADDSIE